MRTAEPQAPVNGIIPVPGAFDHTLSFLLRGKTSRASHLLMTPAALWLTIFLILPLAFLLILSITQRGPYGSFVWTLTGDNFVRAFNPKYLPVLLRTLSYAAATTGICLILGFPFAYYLSFHAGSRRELMLVALMVPFWTSCLVSIYSWIIILGREGLINNVLLQGRILSEPLALLNTPFSVILGLVYFYLPFMVLPLYSSLEKIPRQLIEASYDLGAGAGQTFLKITLPLSLPGVFAGSVLTFIPCMGDFLTAEFMGSPQTYLAGNLIQNQFMMAQDWPFGSALTSLLLAGLVGGLWLYQRWEKA